jgi:hypothetical protein
MFTCELTDSKRGTGPMPLELDRDLSVRRFGAGFIPPFASTGDEDDRTRPQPSAPAGAASFGHSQMRNRPTKQTAPQAE